MMITGRLITDVSYYNEKSARQWRDGFVAEPIEITRPQDQYKLSITYQDLRQLS